MFASGVDILDFTAHHVLDKHSFGHFPFVRVQGDHGLAIAQNRHRIGDLHDLLQLVRDHDASHALFLQVAQQVEQVVDVDLVQCRSGLVQDQQLDFLAQRLGNLDQLLFADPQILDLRVRVDIQAALSGSSRPAFLIVSFQSIGNAAT